MKTPPPRPVPVRPVSPRGWFLRLARQREWFHAALMGPTRKPKPTEPDLPNKEH